MISGLPVSCEDNINIKMFPIYVVRNTTVEWSPLVSVIRVAPSSNLGA
jgi:hypothetical protein